MKHYTPKGPRLQIFFAATEDYTSGVYAVKKMMREAIRATLFYEGFDFDAELSVTLCDKPYIHEKNLEFREKDAPTDVLSFPMYTREELEDIAPEAGECLPLGDIVLCLERAAEQAEELGHSFLREVAFLTVHSVLHLLGYDHELSPEEDELQCARQRDIVEAMFAGREDMV